MTDGINKSCLSQTGHTFKQHVTAGKYCYHRTSDNIPLSYDLTADLLLACRDLTLHCLNVAHFSPPLIVTQNFQNILL